MLIPQPECPSAQVEVQLVNETKHSNKRGLWERERGEDQETITERAIARGLVMAVSPGSASRKHFRNEQGRVELRSVGGLGLVRPRQKGILINEPCQP